MPGCAVVGRAAPPVWDAPLAANQAELNAVAAWALPATISSAMAWASGLSRNIDNSPSRRGVFRFVWGLQRSILLILSGSL
ncbi:hypothetical protein D3C71_1792790 [compost metagenome]